MMQNRFVQLETKLETLSGAAETFSHDSNFGFMVQHGIRSHYIAQMLCLDVHVNE